MYIWIILIGVMVASFIIVFLSVILLSYYKSFTTKKKTLFRVIFGASLIRGLLIAGWLSLMVWITFILFCSYNYSISLALAMSAIALIYMAENLYDVIKTLSVFNKEKKNES